MAKKASASKLKPAINEANMNNYHDLVPTILREIEPQFVEMAAVHNAVNFATEAHFALQVMQSNSFLVRVAQTNPDSLKSAITNVAAIGISLNPALSLSYLVPRDSRICLDISFKGLIKIAADVGSILWGQCGIVREKDTFELIGVDKEPIHRHNPLDENRGEIIGVYCVAKTPTGDFLTTVMARKEIDEIMEKSQAYKAYKSGKTKTCIWVDFYGEMAKKTVIKRAAKLWPHSSGAVRLFHAIDMLNKDGEGIAPVGEIAAIPHEPENYKEKEKLIEDIASLMGRKCAGKSAVEKGQIVAEYCNVKKWSEMERKKCDELKKIFENILADTPVTTDDIPWN